MDQIQEKTDELIKFIRQGEIYCKYSKTLKVLEEQVELKHQMNQFRARLFQMNNETSGIDLFEETDRVEQEYQELQKFPEVNAYLEAELDLCKLLKTIEMKINREIDVHIPEL